MEEFAPREALDALQKLNDDRGRETLPPPPCEIQVSDDWVFTPIRAIVINGGGM